MRYIDTNELHKYRSKYHVLYNFLKFNFHDSSDV
jgi:hypothetical protein